MFLGKVTSFLGLHLPQFIKISFIANHHDNCILNTQMVLELLYPVLDIVKRLSVCHVVGYNCSVCAIVVGRGESFVPLLACRIPYLDLNLLGLYFDSFREEVNTYSRFALDVELVTNEPRKQVSFAH